MKDAQRPTAVSEPTNGAKSFIQTEVPFVARMDVVGVADLLLHAWNCEAVKAKGDAKKGSAAKKTDDLQSYVVRDDKQRICIPGMYFRAALLTAARYRQDPRSPRKSLRDLAKAAIVALTPLSPLNGGVREWEFEHRCRHVIHGAGITRTYPAFKAGWQVSFDVLVNLPQYISPEVLHELGVQAGQLVGMGDMRPTYGRFQIRGFELIPQ